MNWITRLLNNNILANKTESDIRLLPVNHVSPIYSDDGILYNYLDLPVYQYTSNNLMEWALTSELGGQLALYLVQLVEEGVAQLKDNAFLLSWADVYYLYTSSDHVDSFELLRLPKIRNSILSLEERGTLSDNKFAIIINGYIDQQKRLVQFKRTGAVFSKGDEVWLASPMEWRLISAIIDLAKNATANQEERESYWGKIRTTALNASAKLSPYLESVIVLTPENLTINYKREEAIGIGVAIIEPSFADAPKEWLSKFDELRSIPKHIDFASDEGRIRVIFSEPVQSVLQTIKKDFPGRRAGGAKAEAFLRNPFAYLGEDASNVINPDQIENAKEHAGIVPTRLSLLDPEIENSLIVSVTGLIQQTFVDGTSRTLREKISSSDELCEVVNRITSSCAEEKQFFRWRNHIIDIDGDTQYQLDQATRFLGVWQAQKDRFIKFDDIYAFKYTERVEGIGVAKPIYSPYIQKIGGDETLWAPESLSPIVSVKLTPDGPPVSIFLDKDWLDEFQKKIEQAKHINQSHVMDSRLPFPVSIEEAEPLLANLRQGLSSENPSEQIGASAKINKDDLDDLTSKKQNKESLLIKANICQLEYSETQQAKARENRLKVPKDYAPSMPSSKLQEVTLMQHQVAGVAWLQHLISRAPQDCRGAILADDMGLGKTLQLLTVLAAHYEKNPLSPPSLIVAPPALMKNWMNSVKKFFSNFPEILKLHEEGLTVRRQPRSLIDQELLNKKISNLLIPEWIGSSKIILTTYEVVRDYEFSLAKQDFAFLICDEAQKIKTPNALVTLALKKQKANFRIACTGTPVENSLADLWCLFDFIQPGLLGDLSEFGAKYKRQIETKSEGQAEALDLLRKLIEPQVLRRMKEDISGTLPQKIIVSNDKYEFVGKDRNRLSIQISSYQRGLYGQGLTQLRAVSRESDAKKRATISFGVLHFIKAVCAEPYCRPQNKFDVDPRGYSTHLINSPKLKWTLDQLTKIAAVHEKAIIFTELREVQRALIQFIHHKFGFTPLVIHGGTDERQDLIDKFQEKPGFGVIILSPLAVGFGVDIVSANHVIHYSRTWNPAKEDQATDRVYRIGQKKDVYVYCPTIIANDFVTFEDKLDRLMSAKMDLAGDMLDGVGADISHADLMPFDGPSGEKVNLDDLIDLNAIDRLEGYGFEILCKIMLSQSSCMAYISAKNKGDGGVDLVVISSDGTGLLCQCKRTSQSEIGWDAIKEIAAGSAAYQARHPNILFQRVAICNKKFNSNAKAQASILGVRLIERDEILQMLTSSPIKRIIFDEEVLKHCPTLIT